jgi:futalosine hydrolase
MEGAAAAQVCAEFSCPLLEVRGISNPTGTRANERWDIPLGMRVAQEAVLTLLQRGLLTA